MDSTIQISFLYSHLDTTSIEDIHFKSITRLKSSAPEDILEVLYFDMANGKVDVCKDHINAYLNKHINTTFVNNEETEELVEDKEDHIIRHNDNFLLFSFCPLDNSLSIKYLTHTDDALSVVSPIFVPNTNLRENATFEVLDASIVEESKKEKKGLFTNLFGSFKKKKSERVEA